MKIGIVQRVLAEYRVPLFDLLAESYDGNVSVFAGDPRKDEMIDTSRKLEKAHFYHANNKHLFHGKFYLCFQTNIFQWLRSQNPDVLIVEANNRYPLTRWAIHWMHRQNKPVIGWGLGAGFSQNRLKRRFFRQFDAVLTYSGAGAESYRKMGVSPEKIFIAKNAVTERPKRDLPPERSPEISDHPVILFVGRLQDRKRVDLLIEACAALKDSVSPILWIVGDGPARQQITELAAKIFPQTLFFGALYGQELTEKFDQADLFVLPGTGGLALQQAMASGLPVIAAEADGTQTDLVREENGILVKPGDLKMLTDAIRTLLSDPSRLRKMGDRSFQIVRNEINLENMAESFEQAISYAVRNRKE